MNETVKLCEAGKVCFDATICQERGERNKTAKANTDVEMDSEDRRILTEDHSIQLPAWQPRLRPQIQRVSLQDSSSSDFESAKSSSSDQSVRTLRTDSSFGFFWHFSFNSIVSILFKWPCRHKIPKIPKPPGASKQISSMSAMIHQGTADLQRSGEQCEQWRDRQLWCAEMASRSWCSASRDSEQGLPDLFYCGILWNIVESNRASLSYFKNQKSNSVFWLRTLCDISKT